MFQKLANDVIFHVLFFPQDSSCKDSASHKCLLKHTTKKPMYLAQRAQVIDANSCLFLKYPPYNKPGLSSSPED